MADTIIKSKYVLREIPHHLEDKELPQLKDKEIRERYKGSADLFADLVDSDRSREFVKGIQFQIKTMRAYVKVKREVEKFKKR